jgi:hypothetical protein
VRRALQDVTVFAQVSGVRLRSYQQAPAQAIVDSVVGRKGGTFVVMFPRQSGKNELQAQIEAYLLAFLQETDAELVKVSPTWKPQSLNAMRRLERVLRRNILTRDVWRKENGYIYKIGKARIFFLSGAPESHIVGATASTLLEIDEAQEVQIAKYERDILPMAASTNATRVLWGTAWTSQTLLARELSAVRQAEQDDGIRRGFTLSAGQVADEVPPYAAFVAEQVRRLGRDHPLIRTQFYSEMLDAQGGMFPPARRALMQGRHPAREAPQVGKAYALLLDVAGEDEGAGGSLEGLRNLRRDSTAATIVEIERAGPAEAGIQAPTYRAVYRQAWQGVSHASLYGQIRGLAQAWNVRALVVDASGVGTGLASLLERAFPGRVTAVIFSQKRKSDLGWKFLAVVETGRYQEPVNGGALQARFWRQAEACQMEVLEGPGRLMRWGVPDGMRDEASGELVHDDLLLSAALCAELDELESGTWGAGQAPLVIRGPDPLEAMDQGR